MIGLMSDLCNLCPRRCNAARPFSVSASGQVIAGVCHCPRTAVVSGAGLHFWEEPVISGKNGSGTVFFAGCNLHCVFCQNHDISNSCQGKEFSAEALRELYFSLIDGGRTISIW